MISDISAGQYIYTSNTSIPNYNSNPNPLSGSVRINQYGQSEYFDGYVWRSNHHTVNISLSIEAINALTWAIEKMQQEKEIEERCKLNSVVKSAYDAVKKAEEQLKISLILSEQK